jgi:quinol monooxygenase YgiN
VYAAILHLSCPPERHADVVRFLADEMLPVIRANEGFVDLRVLDSGTPGELVMIDTWRRREDSAAAGQRPEALAVHARYTELGISVTTAGRYTVVVHGGP